jgi:hypothetical protein
MSFFGSSKGYVCLGTNNPFPESQRIVGQKLGVTILNEANLANLEKRVVNPNLQQLKLGQPESWLYYENNLASISKELSALLTFRKYRYWMHLPHQNLHVILSLITRHNKLFNETNKFQKVLVIDLLTLFTLSVVQMSAYVLKTNPENPEAALKSYFYGGYDEMKRRQGILENIKKLIEVTPGQKSLFDTTLELDPEYLPKLFDIAFRLLNKPLDASHILRYLQVVLFEKILYKGENEEGMRYLETAFSDVTKKLARDIVRFFRDSTGIPESLVQEVL